MEHSIGTGFFWTSFIAAVLALLAIDLGLVNRRAHTVRFKEAFCLSTVWVLLSLSFGTYIYQRFGRQYGLEFFAGYIIEYALSVDNIFVFILIFSYFAVPSRYHHKVLFWGILGALVMRATFIVAGAALIQKFHWILFVFGAFLVFAGVKIVLKVEKEIEPQHNPLVRLFQRCFPMTSDYGSGTFFVHSGGRWLATPLALVLVTVEATDVIFATDSIPAIFGITTDPFIVYTSNICAILGLRSMYFMLSAAVDRFAYLNTGLGIVLGFVGSRMLLSGFYKIPIGWSLLTVVSILAVSIVLSLVYPPAKPWNNKRLE